MTAGFWQGYFWGVGSCLLVAVTVISRAVLAERDRKSAERLLSIYKRWSAR